jgi:hypothetical protein
MKCGCPRPGLISQCYLASLMSPVRRFVSLKTRRRSRHPGLGRKLPGFRSSQSGGTFSLVSTIAMSRKRHKRSSESTLRLIWPISLKKSADGSALSWYPVADKRKPRPLRPEGSAALEITLSSFRRFCVAAGRWNSSRARSDRVGADALRRYPCRFQAPAVLCSAAARWRPPPPQGPGPCFPHPRGTSASTISRR